MKNSSFRIKLIKNVGGALLACTMLLSSNGCSSEVANQATIEPCELEEIDKYDDLFSILVNKENSISEEQMKRIDMVETTDVNGKTVKLQKDTFNAFNEMKAKLEKEGYKIEINTGFRSYEDQEAIYQELLAQHGQAYADEYSAPVGHSEHHTGLAIDVYFDRTQIFGKAVPLQVNPKYQKCKSRVYEVMTEYGFILRYPEGKEAITGYPEEAWHIRYVGTELAKFISEKGITLEEYHEIMNKYQSDIENESEMSD